MVDAGAEKWEEGRSNHAKKKHSENRSLSHWLVPRD